MSAQTVLTERIQSTFRALDSMESFPTRGRVCAISGGAMQVQLLGVAIGDLVQIQRTGNRQALLASVTGFEGTHATCSPFGPMSGVSPGSTVIRKNDEKLVMVSEAVLGRVLNAFGEPIDSSPLTHPAQVTRAPIDAEPPKPLQRVEIKRQFESGVRLIDSLLPLGCGQRIAVIAPPGVGKTSLLLMLARSRSARVHVFTLVGERGREVQETIEHARTLGILERSVFVVSTSDEPAPCRIRASQTATAIAEYFRNCGADVALYVDSVTRLARAYREQGLAAGERPVRRGYPSSVFSELPRLVERAGQTEEGSITAFYTALSDDSIDEDPLVEELKSLTDGHFQLSRARAERGKYPAIAVGQSVSRIANRLYQSDTERSAATAVKTSIADVDRDRELALIGGNASEELRALLEAEPLLDEFLSQGQSEYVSRTDALAELHALQHKLARA